MSNFIKFITFVFFTILGISCGKKLPELEIDKPWRTTNIDKDTILGGDTTYFKGIIRVSEGVKLTIQPNATLVFNDDVPSALVVMQGAKIIARGDKNGVIRMTSFKKKEVGAWGGLIIIGKEPIINDDPNIPINTDMIKDFVYRNYSGSDLQGSGELKYVEIFYAGGISQSPSEAVSIFNGLTLWGVNKNTLIDSIHIHKSKRNGIVILGGNVDLRHTILTSNHVNSLYYNETWLGRSQFLIIQMVNNIYVGSGISFINSKSIGSSPRFHNTTIIGGTGSRHGINREQEGKGQFYNTLLLGFEENKPIRLQDSFGITTDFIIQWANIQIIKSNSIDVLDTKGINEDILLTNFNSPCMEPLIPEYQLRDPFSSTNPDFSTKTILRCRTDIPYGDPLFFVSSQFYGAVSNTKESDWTLGWATYP